MRTETRYLKYYAYFCNINYISFQELYAQLNPFHNIYYYKSFKIRLLALSTTLVSSDAR